MRTMLLILTLFLTMQSMSQDSIDYKKEYEKYCSYGENNLIVGYRFVFEEDSRRGVVVPTKVIDIYNPKMSYLIENDSLDYCLNQLPFDIPLVWHWYKRRQERQQENKYKYNPETYIRVEYIYKPRMPYEKFKIHYSLFKLN